MGDDGVSGRLPLYRTHYRRLSRACMALSLDGFLVHEPTRKRLADEAARELARLKREIRAAAPFDLFGKGKRKGEDGKGLSNVNVMRYFYDTLKCRPYHNRQTHARTCDEEAIRRLMRAYKKARPVGTLILQWRNWEKRAQFVADARVSEDGRMRSLFVPNAVSGRLRSSATPTGEGSNMQNLPRPPSPVRSIFVPDPGHVLVELDFSRIEDRLLGGMSGSKRMQREAAPDSRVDTYQAVADALEIAARFEELFGPVTTERDAEPLRRPKLRAYYVRQTGKRIKLASGYGMQGETMSKAALLETEGALDLPPRQCDAWLAELKEVYPGIVAYQQWIVQRMLRDGYLENSWGRRLYFRVLRLHDAHYRDGFAWACQSEAGVNTNQLGFLPARRWGKRHGGAARVVQQGHDAIVASVAPEAAWAFVSEIGASMGQERTYLGAGGPWRMAIPVGLKVGWTWMHGTEFKTWPTQGQFAAALAAVVEAVWWKRTRRAVA